MPEKIQVIITIRKEVPDMSTGKTFLEAVKANLAQYPNITVSGHITNHISDEKE